MNAEGDITVEDCKQLEFYLDDLCASPVAGNKRHKLAPYIALAQQRQCTAIVSFGGPYSNHLHALAWACKQAGLGSTGIVRGEITSQLTPTLQDCQRWGMELRASSRQQYRAIQTSLQQLDKPIVASELGVDFAINQPQSSLVVAEGGGGRLAIESLCDAYRSIFTQPKYQHITHVACATGSGATVAGLARAAHPGVQVIGIQAVAEGDATQQRIQHWLGGQTINNLRIVPGHMGGFAKVPPELRSFIEGFEAQYQIKLDPIYNAKVVFALASMLKQGLFRNDDKILVVHTGGLQGLRG